MTYVLPSKKDVFIRKAYLGYAGYSTQYHQASQQPSLYDVSYNIGFNFGGPEAFYVELKQESFENRMKLNVKHSQGLKNTET